MMTCPPHRSHAFSACGGLLCSSTPVTFGPSWRRCSASRNALGFVACVGLGDCLSLSCAFWLQKGAARCRAPSVFSPCAALTFPPPLSLSLSP